jgi:hypothetical protein
MQTRGHRRLWPPDWHLHAGSGLSPVEPSGGVASRYRYDPADPTRPSVARRRNESRALGRTRSKPDPMS